MSVWRRFEGHGYPSLVTSNIAHRRPVFRQHAAARAALDAILGAQQQLKFDLIAWVIMPDHIHLVVQLSEGVRLARVMQLIKGRFASRWNKHTGGKGSVWQDRYHERALRDERELATAVAYVEYNPVAAGLTNDPKAYIWSSASHAPHPTLSG